MINEEILKEDKKQSSTGQILSTITTEAELDNVIIYYMNKAREDERISMTQCRRRLRRRASKKITIHIR